MFAQGLEGTPLVHTVRRVKAHRPHEELELLEGTERLFGMANAAVDQQAKLALNLHPAANMDFPNAVELATTRAKSFVKLAAQVLPLFQMRLGEKRPLRFRSGRSGRPTSWHDWKFGEFGLQCTKCLLLAKRSPDGVPNGRL